MRKLTKEEFVEKAIKKHGEWYDYSKVEYINNSTKVCIICPIHGEFWQTPGAHLSGQGCPQCSGVAPLNKEIFIKRSIEVHGIWYDYSKVEYVNAYTKVCIICPIHGEFWQTPTNHLSGQGCPQCGKINRAKSNTKSQEQVIKEFKGVHGDWYDYSKVEYINSETKVLIICPDHGEFLQAPNDHLRGHGCPYCGKIKGVKSRTKSQEQLIKDFKGVHGDWYDYSKVEYINSETKVLIICPDHGEFLQTPASHLSGCGCPKCVNKNVTKEEWVERSIEVHGVFYDYSKVEYINMTTKVLIICPDHGEFLQTPTIHLSGCGCPYCANNIQLTKEEFVERSIEKHGGWYDYSKVEYINNRTKVLIICPDHGEFWQTPSDHLMGRGCPYCGGTTKLTKEQFVEKAILVHGDWYDYSKVVYVNSQTKVIIICPDHGEFWQTPASHLMGRGCPHCNKSNLENNTKEILNENNINFIQNYRGFDWLKNIKRLELDFYLPEYNVGIECQGKQHFESVKGWGGEQQFINIQYRDSLKKQLCEEHGVNLFYINYDDNVEEKLSEIFLLLENNK